MYTLTNLLFSYWLAFAPLSVASYGAAGNGFTDDTNAINSALAAAHTANKSLYFPAGTYLCNTMDGSGHILTFNDGGLTNVTLYSDAGATILTTDTGTASNGSVLLYIYAFSPGTGLRIDGVHFIGSHPRTNQSTSGIFLTGTSGIELSNVEISNCLFNGFGYDLGGQGINGWNIITDTFAAINGHDDAYYGSNVSHPATNIWSYDNTNGWNYNVNIIGCWASGYTGSFPMVARRPMDNFFYGFAYGLTAAVNQTFNFSEEHFMILPPTHDTSTTASVNLLSNNLDCSLPAGITDENGGAHKYNYGIRCDASNAFITGNTLKNICWGIMQRGTDYSTFRPKNYQITNNTLIVPQDTSTVVYQRAIYVNGNVSYPIPGVTIQNNMIKGIDTIPIQTINTTSPVITPNGWTPILK